MQTCCDHATLVKVCGITRQEDADMCVKLGVDMIGFIFHEPSPRSITPEQAAAIDTGATMRVGLFLRQTPQEVREIMRTANIHLAQLHGDQDEEFCEDLGRARIMRVFWPERYSNLEDLEADLQKFAPYARFFLLDAGTSGGGHGRSYDATFLSGLKSPKTWFVAGGIGPENLCDMLGSCDPCGIDVNSGVEVSPGVKDHARMKELYRLMCRKGE